MLLFSSVTFVTGDRGANGLRGDGWTWAGRAREAKHGHANAHARTQARTGSRNQLSDGENA